MEYNKKKYLDWENAINSISDFECAKTRVFLHTCSASKLSYNMNTVLKVSAYYITFNSLGGFHKNIMIIITTDNVVTNLDHTQKIKQIPLFY